MPPYFYKLLKQLCLLIILLGHPLFSKAQNVGINASGAAPDASAVLDVVATDKGLLVPRVSITNALTAAPVTAPVTSLLVYNTNAAITSGNGVGYYYWDGSQWVKFLDGGSDDAWLLTGNTFTASGTNFLGTTTNFPLDIKTNNILRTRITTKGQIEVFNTGQSVFVGEGAGANDDLSNNRNVFLGYQAGFTNTTGSYNNATGFQALYNNTIGIRNSATGYQALYSNTEGNYNSASGVLALHFNTTGDYNVASGYLALYYNTEGSYNSAVGYTALRSNTIGNYNSATGYRALFNNTEGNNNSAMGYQALYSNIDGDDNSAGGGYALFSNTTGIGNIAMGYRAGDNITTGSNNIMIGYNIDGPIATGSNQMSIGNLIYATGVDGTGATVSAGNVGIGISLPTEKLHVQGGARISSLAGTNSRLVQADATGVLSHVADGAVGQQLTTNGAGLLTWQTPATEGWGLLGNALTASGTNFLGTTTNFPLDIKTNNILRTRITTKGQIEVFNTGESVFVGEQAGDNDDLSANRNVFLGYQAGFTNTTGYNNSATGYDALYSNTIGNYNSAFGYQAFFNGASYSNSTALGYSSNITASNQIRLGNNAVTSIGGFANWSNVSDARFKTNVNENVAGLDFINELRPVTYNLDMNAIASMLNTPDSLRLFEAEVFKANVMQTGFIAQEVEAAAKKIGYNFSGVDAPNNSEDHYGLRYAEFTVPLVKAVQELSKENELLKAENEATKNRQKAIELELKAIKELLKAKY